MEEDILTHQLILDLSKKIDITHYPSNHLSIHLGLEGIIGNTQQYQANLAGTPQESAHGVLEAFVNKHGRGMDSALLLIERFEKNEKGLLVKFLKKALRDAGHILDQPPMLPAVGQSQNVSLLMNVTQPTNVSRLASVSQPTNVSQLITNVSHQGQPTSRSPVVQPPGHHTGQSVGQGPTQLVQTRPDAGRPALQDNQVAIAEENLLRNNLLQVFAVLGLVATGYLVGCYIPLPGFKKCVSNPCQNEAVCNEVEGAYTCTCPPGYGGKNCETEYIAEAFPLAECQETLRKYYEKHLFKIHIKPWDSRDYVDLENHYTTISLYKEDKNNIPDKPLHKSSLNGSINDIFQTKVGGIFPERIVLFGEAGRGKTTAVAKMAYDWATRKESSPLKNVKLLFVFKMRNMNATMSIADAVVQLLGKRFHKYRNNLDDYIDSHEKDIVMLFDGYDEFSGVLNDWGQGGDVMDVLRQERCRRCRILVTSRPIKIKDFNTRNLLYSKMVIEGYSQQHSSDFIDKFFISNPKKGTDLKNYLEEDIVTNEMIATPLFCTMVCYLWNEGYIHGNFTRTKLFDDIMEFLRTHLNAKDEFERTKDIERDHLNDTVVSIGQVAYTKLTDKEDPNPLLLSEDDFSDVGDERVNISFSLGLLTKNLKTEIHLIVYIEFFHKLAQEYSAGRYLAGGLNFGSISTAGFQDSAFDIKEILQFASGTSDIACRMILASILDRGPDFEVSNRDYLYHPIMLDFISETTSCADQSQGYLASFLQDGKLQLRQVTASTVVGFEKLPGSVKEKITTIDISGTTSSPGLFVRLWNNLHTCNNLIHMEMYRHVPPTISPSMRPLYTVNSFTTSIQPPADDYVEFMSYIPNIQDLVIYCDDFGDQAEFALTPTVFGKLWNQLNSSSLLRRLSIPIPTGASSYLKPLSSIHVFETDNVLSLTSFSNVMTLLPNIRELLVQEKDFMELDNNPRAFCGLWENLRTSPELYQVLIPIPSRVPCSLGTLKSVEFFETKSSSFDLLVILSSLPNLHTLILHSDIPGYPAMDVRTSHKFFVDLWKILQSYHRLQHLKLVVPFTVPTLLMEPLRSVKTFQTKIKSQMEVFPILLSRLPNVTDIDIWASNNYHRKMPENIYYDRVMWEIIDGLVKNCIRLEVLNMTFDPRRNASNTVSHETVHDFIRMLKMNATMRQLEITSFNYCVFKEGDLVEIVTAIRTFTSIMIFRLDCNFDPEGELSQYAIQNKQTVDENEKKEKKKTGSLRLTLYYRDPETFAKIEKNFFLPRLQV